MCVVICERTLFKVELSDVSES